MRLDPIGGMAPALAGMVAIQALAGCQQSEPASGAANVQAKMELPEGDVSMAERRVREHLGNPQGLVFGAAKRSASQNVPIICGTVEQGAVTHLYIVVGSEEVFVEPRMERGEMDRAYAEFCGGRGRA